MARPKPTALDLAARGERHRDRLPRRDAATIAAPPALEPLPGLFGEHGQAEWRRIVSIQHDLAEIGQHWLTLLDAASLAAYCQAFELWILASLALTAHAKRQLARQTGEDVDVRPLIFDFAEKDGRLTMAASPYVAEVRRASRHMEDTARAIMLNPRARQQLAINIYNAPPGEDELLTRA